MGKIYNDGYKKHNIGTTKNGLNKSSNIYSQFLKCDYIPNAGPSGSIGTLMDVFLLLIEIIENDNICMYIIFIITIRL